MIKRFCMNCGTEVMVEEGTRMVLCPECKAEKARQSAIKAREAAKAKKAELGLVNVSIYGDTRDKIKELAKEHGVLFADMLKELVEGVGHEEEEVTEPTEEVKHEEEVTEPVEEEKPKAKAKSKAKKSA